MHLQPTTKLILFGLLGFVLWTIMFSPWTAPYLNFWLCMTGSACLLTTIAFWQGGAWWKHIQVPQGGATRYWLENIVLGIVIAIVLWGVFWVGDKLSQLIFPSFARAQVDNIYNMKNGTEAVILSLLLLFIIGPAEEIFWRGFFQRQLSEHLSQKYSRPIPFLEKMASQHPSHCKNGFWRQPMGVFFAFVLATIVYALVHLFSLNFMLIMAALVCGVAWGGLYWLFPNRFPAILLSHALWDAAVFIWFPIM